MAYPWKRKPKPSAHAVPYHADLDTKLLRVGKKYLTLRDFCESFSIIGGPGSGKTSASMRAILHAYCQSGFGIVYHVYKSDAVKEIQDAARAAGRLNDLVYINSSEHSARINLLDFVIEHLGGDKFDQNLVAFMEHMMEASRKASGSGGGNDAENKYFSENALKMASHAFPLLRAAWENIRLREFYDFVTSIPMTEAEALSPAWQASSFCFRTLARLAQKRAQALADGKPDARLERVIAEHGDFFVNETAKLDIKPKTSIISTLTNSIYPFLTGALHDIFCTDTTFSPLDCREGAILVLDLPISTGTGGIVAQVLLKYICGLAWQIKPTDEDTRPCSIVADECQFYISSSDADLLSTARSAKISICYATQDVSTFYAKLGSNSRDVADSILSKFGCRLFHSNTSTVTNEMASAMIGREAKYYITETRSTGATSGVGGNRHDASGGFNGQSGGNTSSGQSTSGYTDFAIAPDYFSHSLRTGGKANNYKVDAILLRNGRVFTETGKHWVKVEFSQK